MEPSDLARAGPRTARRTRRQRALRRPPRLARASRSTTAGTWTPTTTAAPATVMETYSKRSRQLRWAILPAAATIAATLGSVVLASGHQPPPGHAAQAFSWLRPAPVPSGWHVGVTRTGARLAYPTSWRELETDRGSVPAAPTG